MGKSRADGKSKTTPRLQQDIMGIYLRGISKEHVGSVGSMRRIAPAIAAALLQLQSGPVVAQTLAPPDSMRPTPDPCRYGIDLTTMRCGNVVVTVVPGHPADSSGVSSPQTGISRQVRYVPDPTILWNGGQSGEACVSMGYRQVPVDSAGSGAISDIPSIFSLFPRCPAQPGSTVVETPESLALRFWQDVPLPCTRASDSAGPGHNWQVRVPRDAWLNVVHVRGK